MAAFVTTERARQAPQLATADVNALADWLAGVCKAVERYCGRTFAQATFTEKYDGDNDRSLLLNQYPVTSVTKVTITDSDGDSTEYTGSTYFDFNANTGELRWKPTTTGVFTDGFQNISVIYVAGYSPIPADLEEAVVQIVCSVASANVNDPAMIGERIGEYSYTRQQQNIDGFGETTWPPFARKVIARYRDLRV